MRPRLAGEDNGAACALPSSSTTTLGSARRLGGFSNRLATQSSARPPDGLAALATAGSLRPDVVLLDIQLPDMSGFEVALELAAVVAPSDIVLVSSRSATAYGERIDRCGARGFIWKGDLTVAALAAIVGAA